MQKYKVLVVTIALFGAMFFVSSLARAEEAVTTTTNETAQIMTESATLANEPEVLDGVQVAEPKNVPSGFGFWWNDLKENISLALTFDPVKKAEKQLQFAAQRVKLAEYMIANSTDTKVQEKAQQLLARANEYTQKIEERKSELIKSADQEKVKKLLNNAAKQQMNLELTLDKIEDKIPPEKIEVFQQLRQQIENGGQQFLDNLQNNPDVPREVKDKLLQVQTRIEAMLLGRETFRAQQKDILDEIKAGKEEAKVSFEALREERKQRLEQAREEYKDLKEAIIERIKSGEEAAVEELKALNQERKTEIKQVEQGTKDKAQQIKADVKTIIKEGQQELKENRPKKLSPSASSSALPSASASPDLEE